MIPLMMTTAFAMMLVPQDILGTFPNVPIIVVLYQNQDQSNGTEEIFPVSTDLLLDINIAVVFQEVPRHNILNTSTAVCEHLQEGGIGFIGFLDCQTTRYMDYYSSRLHIPSILYATEPCDPEDHLVTPPTVRMAPDCYTMNKAISSVVESQAWSEVVIVYDAGFNSRCMQNLLMTVSKLLTHSHLVKIMDETNITHALSDRKEADGVNFIVIVSMNTLENLLQTAYLAGMLDSNYFWVIVETSPLLCWDPPRQYATYHVVVLRRRTFDLQTREQCVNKKISAVLVDEAMTIFSDAFNSVYSNNDTAWHSTNHSATCTDLKTSPSPWMQAVRSQMLVTTIGSQTFDSNGYPHTMQYDILSTADRRNTTFSVVATWDNLNGIAMKESLLFLNTFIDFGNRTLLIATQEAKPFTIRSEINGSVSFTGFCLDILDELAVRFNFRYTLVEPPDGLWGGPEEDGTWNGMVGMVKRREIAFAIGPFTITSLRESVIDFTKPFMEDGAGILTTRPDANSDKLFRIIRPFALPVWGCIAIAIICVGVLLFIVNRLSPYSSYNRRVKDSSPDEIGLTSNMWLVFGTFVGQGGVVYPTAISGRCIVGFWWVFTILITSTYTANLAAFLTVTIAVKPINSLNELGAHQQIKPLVKAGTNLYSLFQTADSGIYKTIWNRMADMPEVKNANDALAVVRTSDTAYMTDRSQLEYVVLSDCKTYALADEIFNTAGYGFVVPENAPFLESFNYNIMRMQEAGLIEKWRQKWWPRSDQCSMSDRTSSATALGIDSLAGPFLVYVFIAGMSFVCLLFEICLKRRAQAKQKKKATLHCHHTNGVGNGILNNGFD